MSRLRYQPAAVRGGLWAWRSLRSVRRQLARGRLADITVDRPPTVGGSSRKGAAAALLIQRATCLERSLVLQAHDAAAGFPRDVLIGVQNPGEEFGAHAWLDGEGGGEDFVEIHRIPAG